MPVPYKRVLLKLSGELLKGKEAFGIDKEAGMRLAKVLHQIQSQGTQLGVVIGGGNIFRGSQIQALGLPKAPADQIGMLSTLMNGIALQQLLEGIGCPTLVLSALDCPKVAESYTWNKAQAALKQNKVILFVGGTGNPFFTTDTAAALRAGEIQADILLKGTKVDGIYDKDPLKYPGAKKYEQLTYEQFLAQKLQVMDATSVALCMSNAIPIRVFNMELLFSDQLSDILTQSPIGTLVTGN